MKSNMDMTITFSLNCHFNACDWLQASAIEERKKNYTISSYIKLNLIFLKNSTEEDKKKNFLIGFWIISSYLNV